MSYLDSLRSAWMHNDPEALKHKVGARQFTPEIVEWYNSQIFSTEWFDPKPGLHIADYGCGVARLVKPFTEYYRFADWQFYGFDISPSMITAAEKECPGAWFFNCDGAGIPDYDHLTLDYIYSVITLQHVCSSSVVDRILNSFASILAHDGQYVIQVKRYREGLRPHDYEPPAHGVPEILLGFPQLPAHLHIEEGNSYTVPQIVDKCRKNGLSVNQVWLTAGVDDHGDWIWVRGGR
jgi:SAM-dependent methyltransferase